MRLKGKTAIITGAGKGIGRSAALLFAQEGAAVVVADVDAQSGQSAADEVLQNGGRAVFIQANVSDSEQVKKIVSTALENFGGINVLYNNAAIFRPEDGKVTDRQERDWDRIIAVNLKGTFLCCKYAIP